MVQAIVWTKRSSTTHLNDACKNNILSSAGTFTNAKTRPRAYVPPAHLSFNSPVRTPLHFIILPLIILSSISHPIYIHRVASFRRRDARSSVPAQRRTAVCGVRKMVQPHRTAYFRWARDCIVSGLCSTKKPPPLLPFAATFPRYTCPLLTR